MEGSSACPSIHPPTAQNLPAAPPALPGTAASPVGAENGSGAGPAPPSSGGDVSVPPPPPRLPARGGTIAGGG